MPLRKFRSVEAMNEATERARLARGVDWEAIAHVLAIAGAGAPRRMVPGVHKFRTVAEWNAASEKWEQAAVDMAVKRAHAAKGRHMAQPDDGTDDPRLEGPEPQDH